MKPMKFGIGQPVKRVEDAKFITGQGRYTADCRAGRNAAGRRPPLAPCACPLHPRRHGGGRAACRASSCPDGGRRRPSRRLPCLAPVQNTDGRLGPAARYPLLADGRRAARRRCRRHGGGRHGRDARREAARGDRDHLRAASGRRRDRRRDRRRGRRGLAGGCRATSPMTRPRRQGRDRCRLRGRGPYRRPDGRQQPPRRQLPRAPRRHRRVSIRRAAATR